MHTPRRARMVAAAAAVLLSSTLVACSGDEDMVEEPSFATAAPDTASESDDEETSQPETETSETESSTEATTSGAKASKNPLDNGDGTYRLTADEPGPGAAEEIESVFTSKDMEKHGFTTFTLTTSTNERNGNMQWVMSSSGSTSMYFTAEAEDLAGNPYYGTCRYEASFIDDEGNATPSPDIYSGSSKCTGQLSVKIPRTGDFTFELTITNPGYEPLVIRQPIKVV